MPRPFDYSILFTICTLNFFFGFQVYAVPYDYSYIHTWSKSRAFYYPCKPKAEPPLYSGGMIVNPELNDGLKGWAAVGNAKIEIAQSPDGNNYIVASNRLAETDGVSQTVNLESGKYYIVSAWVQISVGKGKVHATIMGAGGANPSTGGFIRAESGCWKMIKGGLVVNATGAVDLHFSIRSNTTEVDVWVDSVSLQAFTLEEWASHQEASREKVRKSAVKFQAMDENKKPVPNAVVSIRQRRPNFPWGNAMNAMILDNPTYQKWFLDRFQYTVFENEMKWDHVELTQGQENYTLPDAMLQFAKSNNLTVRGQNVICDDIKYQRPWVKELGPEAMKTAVLKRVNSLVTRYKGQLAHWDVVNENMHYYYFSNLDPGKFGSHIFDLVHQLDPASLPFLNEFGTIENCNYDDPAMPTDYLDKIAEIRTGGYSGPLGIGVQGHFSQYKPNIPYTRAAIDILASTGLPIWITEFDVNLNINTGFPPAMLEMILHELYSHPAVQGIVLWASMGPNGKCYFMCMTGLDYKNTVAGDVVDKFISEFIKVADTNGTTDANGVFEASLFHGEYEASVGGSQSPPQTFSLVPKGDVSTVQLNVKSGGSTGAAQEL